MMKCQECGQYLVPGEPHIECELSTAEVRPKSVANRVRSQLRFRAITVRLKSLIAIDSHVATCELISV